MGGTHRCFAILIVDDNDDLRVVLRRVIQRSFDNEKLIISEATSGLELPRQDRTP